VATSSQRSTIDFGFVLALLGRVLRTKSFFIVGGVCLLLAGTAAYLSKATYRSEAVLLYQDRGGANPLVQRDAPSPRRIGATLQEMLFSHALLENLIKEFGLYPDINARLGMVAAVEAMRKDLQFNAREGYTFRVAFQSTEPEEAQVVAARASDLLIRALADARAQEAKETELFLDNERARAEQELRKNESALALFSAQHPEAVESLSGKGAVAAAAAASASSDSSSLGLEMQALQLRQRLAQLRQTTGSSPSSASVGVPKEVSEARVRAEAELVAAQRELAEKRTQFTDEYPDVKRAAARVASAKAALRHVEESALAGTPSVPGTPRPAAQGTADHPEAKIVQEQLELVERQVRAVRSQARAPLVRSGGTTDPVTLGRLRAQYTELERRVRESRDHHDLLENRQFQAEMQSLFTTQAKRGDLVVVDPAYKPAVPVRSPRPKILAAGVAGSLFFALVVSLIFVLRDDRLRRAEDLIRFDLPPLLSEVPPP
jgi:uncharacterized protein involved in exopolysaccharide biosynthesis